MVMGLSSETRQERLAIRNQNSWHIRLGIRDSWHVHVSKVVIVNVHIHPCVVVVII